MTMPPPVVADEFRHEACLYAGLDGFMAAVMPFVHGALAADEPILVVLNATKIEMIRAELGGDADRVLFGDMAEVGRNPNRIIPVWHEFVARRTAGGRRVRGIGEPIWSGRSAAELIECQRHELLLNTAFYGGQPWRLLCPYDVGGLAPDVINEAYRTHPYIVDGADYLPSTSYPGGQRMPGHLEPPLPEPVGHPEEVPFAIADLRLVRQTVLDRAVLAGLDDDRAADLALAVHELATNSVRHGGGKGLLRLWMDADTLICEVRDRGHIEDLLVGRRQPPADQQGGRGMWLVNQLSDLAQLRTSPTGTVVRVHMSRRS